MKQETRRSSGAACGSEKMILSEEATTSANDVAFPFAAFYVLRQFAFAAA